MPVNYAAWNVKRRDRPLIAVLRRSVKSMSPSTWLVGMGIIAAFTLLGLGGKHRGTLFSDEAPKWASKFVMGLSFCGMYAGIAGMKRFGVHEPAPVKPTRPNGTAVQVEIGNRFALSKVDFGAAAVENGRLLFAGEHSDFQVRLSEIEVTKVNNVTRSLMVRIPSTKQRVQITSNAIDDVLTWPSFVADLLQASNLTGPESVYPPKTSSWSWVLPLAVILGVILFTEGVIVGAWFIAKKMPSPLYPTFILFDLLLLSIAVLVYLQIDLRLWHRRRMRTQK